MRSRSRVLGLMTVSAFMLAACAAADSASSAAEAKAAAQANWKLSLESAESLPLERMDIYLVEDDESEAEVFAVQGEGVLLVGEFPTSLHVGYEEDLQRLVGSSIALSAEGGRPGSPEASFVTVGGRRLPVVGGTLQVERVTGKWDGDDGDKTLWGTVEVVVSDGGERTLRGTFAVHAVSWG